MIAENHSADQDATQSLTQGTIPTMTYCSGMSSELDRSIAPSEDSGQFESQFESSHFHFNGGLSPSHHDCTDFPGVDIDNLELMDILNYADFADW